MHGQDRRDRKPSRKLVESQAGDLENKGEDSNPSAAKKQRHFPPVVAAAASAPSFGMDDLLSAVERRTPSDEAALKAARLAQAERERQLMPPPSAPRPPLAPQPSIDFSNLLLQAVDMTLQQLREFKGNLAAVHTMTSHHKKLLVAKTKIHSNPNEVIAILEDARFEILRQAQQQRNAMAPQMAPVITLDQIQQSIKDELTREAIQKGFFLSSMASSSSSSSSSAPSSLAFSSAATSVYPRDPISFNVNASSSSLSSSSSSSSSLRGASSSSSSYIANYNPLFIANAQLFNRYIQNYHFIQAHISAHPFLKPMIGPQLTMIDNLFCTNFSRLGFTNATELFEQVEIILASIATALGIALPAI